MTHLGRVAHARSHCRLSPLGQAIGESFLVAYLDGPPALAAPVYRAAYLRASERLLASEEGSAGARAARREMGLHRDALHLIL